MQQKFSVGIVTFSYGGNGGISSEVPDIREWMIPLVAAAGQDERIGSIRVWNLSDTPITMTRNRAVIQARQHGIDVLLMVDSDMKPDLLAGQDPAAKAFFPSAFDFLVKHYHKGPCVIGAPYCGPPPAECVYVFRWQNMQSEHPNPDFQLEMYDRHTAAKLAGIQECAALPTGLIMYDMRAFELTEPKSDGDKPWFYYEWKDKYAAEKASTEDVTMTRDLSLVGAQKLGYNPVFCNWDAWAGHWKPKCVGKPVFIAPDHIAGKMKQSFEAAVDPSSRIVDFSANPKFLAEINAAPKPALAAFDDLGMGLPDSDAHALQSLIKDFISIHGRPPEVAEIGSWAGRSAIIMANAGARVLCIDHWKGNKNDKGTDGVHPGKAFTTFLSNTRAHRASKSIDFIAGDSLSVAKQLACHGRMFDIVYIDAEHDYESVKADIEAWRPLAKHIIAGHDYHSFSSVKDAVNDSFVSVITHGNVWSAKAQAESLVGGVVSV